MISPTTTVLEEAQEIITGERRKDYGDVEESFRTIAALWSAVIDHPVSSRDVALCLIQLKIARYQNGQQRDSLVDIAGYTGCLAMLDGTWTTGDDEERKR